MQLKKRRVTKELYQVPDTTVPERPFLTDMKHARGGHP
jgi:hypothetical protein